MGKQRAQKRAQQHALQQQEAKATREARQTKARQRAQRRRARGSSRARTATAGLRRSRRQRIGITAVAVGGIALFWILAALRILDVGLAIALSVLLLVALPAFVVLALGRRY